MGQDNCKKLGPQKTQWLFMECGRDAFDKQYCITKSSLTKLDNKTVQVAHVCPAAHQCMAALEFSTTRRRVAVAGTVRRRVGVRPE